MTLAFWLTLAALIGLALVFVLYPLVFHRPERSAVNDIRHQNLLAYRSRLAELETERDAGSLDEATYQQMKEELAGSLLDDVGQSEQEAQRVSRRVPGRRPAMAIVAASVVLVPAASLWLYNDWGGVDQLEQYQTMLEMRQTDQAQGQQMAQLAEQLRQRLLDNPENLEGWAMLGRTYMNLENYAQAAWAYEQLAGQLDDVPAEAATAWGLAAQARFFESRGAMNDKVMGAISEARERNPDEVNVLGLLGINAFERQAYQEAIDYWERIIEVAPDHPQLPSIRQGVAEAYRRLGQPVPDSLAQPAGASVTVRVELADAFKDQIPPDTALFIFARAAEGGGMPLAVARLTAAQLPTTVTLDDSMAMAPGAKLSGAQRVTLAARLSPSGNAIPQSGDWQGEGAAPVDLGDYEGEPVEVVIDRRVP
ncbi:c-type cytochrome biogenesis protein CcmI [Marinobacter nanhaiticus D15-8W]|uniref:C-type cytochrome biogenesis protein CcmI n=1 Tax=Marinobacter nanhaiticus D15-8W TaxID=626887 RepID=N6W3E5_9GAMM|nr:c-type cytochrome biogenesis protein CcmI [Marinobacter nanhaiticus]ENO17070.1 c-type cytochrome biogenesis protein CcmI [Marinobacter nanhaiticus D15-8W]BES71934.1 c-type cytochrome biogenesis protein CcmI [Marinobacter nanhaiticus D15-8W]